ncbi:MAG: PAS domain S-box protein [Pleurocapsa sp.]
MTDISESNQKRGQYQSLLINLLRLISITISIVLFLLGCGLFIDWFGECGLLLSVSDRFISLVTITLSLLLAIISFILNRDRQIVFKDRLKIEQALKQSKAKYKAIVEEQTELICRYRQDSTISFVNDAYCRYFDLDKSELIDREFAPLVYDEDRDQVAQMISSMNQTNPTVTIEHRVWVKGKLRWNQWNNRIICDITGEDCEYQAVGRDITSLKEIEIRLRESEEKFRRAFEDAATGEALVTPDGKLLQVNRSLCEMLGYDETELLGKTFQELTHPDDLNLDLDNVQQMLAGEIRSYQMEKRYFHHRGYVVWVLLSVSLVRDIDGKPIYFISQVQDIDRRKRAETELNALVSELERSNQELDEFATVVSHDLTSPLRKQLILID